MTVKELIEKLQTLNLNAEVVIEEGSRECYPVREENIEEDMITNDYHPASVEDLEAEVKVVIRA